MSYKCNKKYLKDALLKAGKLVQQMNVLRPVLKKGCTSINPLNYCCSFTRADAIILSI